MSERRELRIFQTLEANRRKKSVRRKAAKRRDKFLTLASDGQPRTCNEIREMMGMEDDIKVTTFLRAIKFRLVVDRTGWRLKVATEGSRLIWWLEEKPFESESSESKA